MTKTLFTHVVEIKHLDGSYCCFHNAYITQYGNNWITINTEHLGIIVLNKEDLEYVNIKPPESTSTNNNK